MGPAQLAGQDHLVGLDRRRADAAGQKLEPVPTPASTNPAGIAKRFTGEQLRAVEAAVGVINTEWVARLPAVRRGVLLHSATIDGDTTDVEVYGRGKQDAAHAYTGALNLRPHLGFWAEAGVPLAGELMGGTEDPRASCVACWTGPSPRCRPGSNGSAAGGTPATSPRSWPRRAWAGVSSSRSAPNAPRP